MMGNGQQNIQNNDNIQNLITALAEVQVSNNKILQNVHQQVTGNFGNRQMQLALSEMSQTQQYISLNQYVLDGESKFDGSIKKYISFMSHMMNNVFTVVKNPKWRFDILMRSCVGEPHSIGQSILSTGNTIERKLSEFLDALNNRFGSSEKIVTKMIRDVRKYHIENHDFETHIKFYSKLKNTYETASNFGFAFEFDNVKGISFFLKKIPEDWKRKFIEKMTKKGIRNRNMFALDPISGEVSLKMKPLEPPMKYLSVIFWIFTNRKLT